MEDDIDVISILFLQDTSQASVKWLTVRHIGLVRSSSRARGLAS